jgi:rfaE bifunctional protein kinase chain/domain
VRESLELVQAFRERNILMVGDTIVDVYVYGTVLGTSAETPTIVARELETKTFLGGAFLVARHLLELGARLSFMTLVGEDPGASVITGFAHPKLTLLPVTDDGRKTTIKKRFWVDGYKLLQFDQLDNRPLADALVPAVEERLREAATSADAIVVSDYRHGLLSPAVVPRVVALAKELRKPLYVDSQVSQSAANHALYRGATVVCMNMKEARAVEPTFALGDGPGPTAPSVFNRLREKLGIDNIVIKLGERGATALIGERVVSSDALKVGVVDTCGAGDAFLAALCLGGVARPELSLGLANRWAGLSTTVHGTVPPRQSELVETLEKGL